ncbi:MAG: tetraacyldisaccharide 4'-kinase, partial [Hyphomicrobiaceae bacterium]
MPLEEPSWWYEDETTATARMLMPLARLYARAALRRLDHAQPYRSRLPVICIGNFTAGGTGKTPLTLHVARHLVHLGEQPAILTRGYGGKVSGAHWIDADRDRADVTGDEPLLLARAAPTLISRDRRAGAIAIEASGRDVSVIVMDDGLQNPALTKDLTIAIVDGTRGVGNGLVIPAGPLRAPLDRQLALADAILVNRPP